MIHFLIYAIIGFAYSFYVHTKLKTNLLSESKSVEQSLVIGFMEYIIIPLFFPFFIIYRIIKFKEI
jgi:hypothetical protein